MRLIILLLLFINIYAGDLTVEQLFNVKTVKVKKIDYQTSKKFYGSAEIDESRVNDIVLRANGYIADLNIDKKYSYVKKGSELFTIYSPEIYLASSELLNTLDSTHVKLKKSIITKMRLFNVDEKVINEIINTKKIKENMPFYSDSEGYVIEKTISKGSSVKAGQLLYKIADFKKMWVIAKVYESDLGFVKKGMKAKIKFDGINKEYSSKVDFIYPNIISSEKSVNVRFILNNNNLKIFPGSFAKITLNDDKRTLLALPKSAVITKGDKHFVFVVGEYEGEYEPKIIEAKRLNSNTFQIVSGLNEGDIVVNDSLFLFDSDAQINGMY